MIVTFLTTAGPHVGQHFQVGTGKIIRVGRTARSDYALPLDTYLSGAHFEITYDGEECHIRDLGSSNGTFLNGTQITASAVRDGDRIDAGETTFMVQVRQADADPGAVEPTVRMGAEPAAFPGHVQERTERLHVAGDRAKPSGPVSPLVHKRALEVLMGQTAPLFTVLDASRDTGVLGLLGSSPVHYQPLFDEKPETDPGAHAPYLVDIGQRRSPEERNAAQAFLENLLQLGWGKSWGVFLTSLSPLEELRQHFRQFVPAVAQVRPGLHLRFYDPRVLCSFAPACDAVEIDFLFGPVLAYLVESELADAMLVLSRGAERLVMASLELNEQSSPAQAGA